MSLCGTMSSAEKPFHYNYLRDFRTQQCPLFLQHKCTQHRPFTCFHYHFANQRRRRPRKKKDNVFNYSPDIYCSVYDEATGVCKNGDECPYLHRVAGDVERRYHLRYYKTAMCVYETDARGYCVKNGAHCAYSHGPDDLRQPVFDNHTDPSSASVSAQLSESTESIKVGSMDSGSGLGSPRPRSYSGSSVRSDKSSAFDDQRWQDATYVLVFYKTELCPKPARACRQGYACPYFHNARDRRRSPKTYKYRSTPCPSVKHGDEWGDPTQCENGDACQYCHSRTEQQFHPEIYKSTRCNDMLQTNQCPRGPFCAFAHYDQEICSARDLLNDSSYIPAFSQSPSSGASLPSSVPSSVVRPSSLASPAFGSPVSVASENKAEESPQQQAVLRKQLLSIDQDSSLDYSEKAKRKQFLLQHRALSAAGASPDMLTSSSSFASVASGSQSQGLSTAESNVGASASGSSSTAAMNSHLDHLVGASLEGLNMDDFEVTDLEREINNHATGRSSQRDGSFMGLGYGSGLDIFSQPGNGRATSSATSSSSGRHGDLFDSGDQRSPSTSGGACGNGLSSSLTPMRSPYLNTVQQHLPTLGGRSGEQAAASRLASSIFSGYGGPNIGLGSFFGGDGGDGAGAPDVRDVGGTRSRDSPRLGLGGAGGGGGSVGAGGHPGLSGPGPNRSSSFGHNPGVLPPGADTSGFAKAIGSHRSGISSGVDPLPLPTSSSSSSQHAAAGSLGEQLSHAKRRLSMWETSWQQAKSACEAWRKEVESSSKKIQDLEEENEALKREKTAAESRVKDLELCSSASSPMPHGIERTSSTQSQCSGIHTLEPSSRLMEMPLETLKQHLNQLQDDQTRLMQVVTDRQGSICMVCKEERRSVVCEPCLHCVMCERCATSNSVCPYCANSVDSTISVFLPPAC